jgi:hypothetical protein
MRGVGWGVLANLQHTVAVDLSKLFPHGIEARLAKFSTNGQHIQQTADSNPSTASSPVIYSLGKVKVSRGFPSRN